MSPGLEPGHIRLRTTSVRSWIMKTLPLLGVLSLSVLLGSCAQSSPHGGTDEPLPLDASHAKGTDPEHLAQRMVEQELQEGEASAILRDLTQTAPHRLSGSAGADRAVLWALAKMKNIGLSNVRAEKCAVPHWVRGQVCRVEIGEEGARKSIPALALGGSIGTPKGGLEGEVIVVRSFEALARRGADVKGKIVLFNRPMPRALMSTFQAYGRTVPQRTQGASEAARYGAIAAIVRSMTTAIDDVPHTGVMHYKDGIEKIPTAAISTRGADKIADRIRRGERLRLRLDMDCQNLPDRVSANVVGELRGREKPSEIVLIGGHLDGWDVGEGAHDDGAGVTHCLEAVNLLHKMGLRPKRTIRVVLFMNEENGLRGALAYEATHRKEMKQHVAAIESDRGGFTPRGFTTSAKGRDFEELKTLTDALRPFEMGALIPGGGGADIGPLGAHGVTLFGLIPSSHRYFDYHHSERDRFEAVNERELALGAAAMAWMAWSLAER